MSGEVMEAVDAREEHIARALRALCIIGRQLVKISAGWSVMSSVDRRRRARLVLENHEVARLVCEDRLIVAGEDFYVLADVRVEPPTRIEPWAYVGADKRRTGTHAASASPHWRSARARAKVR